MRDFFYAFKSSCLFVGTVIGAGFATGEEIKLYFSGTDIGSVCLSALFFGLFSALFMVFGKIKSQNTNKKTFWSFAWSMAKSLALLISFLAMVTAVEELIFDGLAFHGGGILTTAICFYIVIKNKDLSVLNSVVVPIIVILVFAVFLKSGEDCKNVGEIGIIPAFCYASMNIFTAGMMVKKEGKNMSAKQIFLSAVTTTIIVGLLMICIKVATRHTVGSMPVLIVAKTAGLGAFASVVIYLAIITTLLSDISLLLPQFEKLLRNKFLVMLSFALIISFSKLTGFSQIVALGYPMIGVVGVLYLSYALIRIFREFFLNKRNYGVHTTGKHA